MKQSIRNKIKNDLQMLFESEFNIKSQMIKENLYSLNIFKNIKNIGIYFSKKHEVLTHSIIQDLIKLNLNVYLPKIKNDELEFRKFTTLDETEIVKFGIIEPNSTCEHIDPRDLNLLILPCVAVDRNGNRLGRGCGYFDRLLQKCTNLKTVCLAFDVQLLQSIPVETHDKKTQIIVTESQVIYCDNKQNNIMSGKNLAQKILNEAQKKILENEIKAKLAVILVGKDPASLLYVKIKTQKCESIGIEVELKKYDEQISEQDILKMINKLNQDFSITGILVQLPLPKHIDLEKIINSVAPEKDVDGLTLVNNQLIEKGMNALACCTPMGIMRLLNENKINLHNKKIVIVGYGRLVGKPLASILKSQNIEFDVCTKETANLFQKTSQADILICATGVAKLIKGNYVKTGAVVIDAGTAKLDNKIVGDVDFENVVKKASLITPVPGGVGPMTIAMLVENILKAYYIQKENRNDNPQNSNSYKQKELV